MQFLSLSKVKGLISDTLVIGLNPTISSCFGQFFSAKNEGVYLNVTFQASRKGLITLDKDVWNYRHLCRG
jgi:hypothetical protein